MGKKLTEDEIKWVLSVESSKSQQEVHKLDKAIKDLNRTNDALRKRQADLVASGKKESDEYRRLTKEIRDNNTIIGKNRAIVDELTKRMDLSQLTMGQLSKRAKELRTQLRNTSQAADPQAYKRLSTDLKAVENRMDELNVSGRRTSSMFSAGMVKATLYTAAIGAVGAAMRSNININKDFEQAVADLAAILGVVPAHMQVLIADAKQLGATTKFTASQVAELQTELAKLGFSQEEIHNATEPILQFAGAVDAELPRAAAVAGAALRAFGLDSSETTRAVATMTAGCNKSALSFEYLETAMAIVSPVAKAFGFTIEDTTALLGVLSDSGFDASMAATATRNILLNLANSSGKLATALGQPITTLDDLVPALIKLRDEGVDLNTTLEITDKRSVAAFNTFLSGAEKVTKLRDAVTDADDILKQMQQTRIDTSKGSEKLLQSAWEGLMLRMEGAKNLYRTVVDGMTTALNTLNYALTSSADKLQQQLDKVVKLNSTLPDLVDRYEDLKSKTTLTVDEQTELRDVINQIGTSIPGVITKFDEYGNAIELNTRRIWDYLAAEKARLRYLNSEAIDEAEKKIKKAQEEIDFLQSEYAAGGRLKRSWSGGVGYRSKSSMPELYDQILAQQEIIKGAQEQLKKLRGDDIEEQAQSQARQVILRKQFNEMSKEELQVWILMNKNATDDVLRQESGFAVQSQQSLEKLRSEYAQYAQMAQDIYDQRFPVQKDTKSGKDPVDKNPNATALKNLEAAHQEELNTIRRDGQQKELTEGRINEAILQSDIEYYDRRIQALEVFQAAEKKANKKADYGKQIVDARAKQYATEVSLEKNTLAEIDRWRTEALTREDTVTKASTSALEKQLAQKKITQQQYELAVFTLTDQSAQRRLAIEETYLGTVNSLELNNGTLKADAVTKANKAVLEADLAAAKSRAAQQTKLDSLIKDFKGQFKITTVDEDLQAQMVALEASYQARKEFAQQNNLDTTAIDEAYLRAKEKLVQDSEARIFAIRKQYGLTSMQEEYQQQLQQLQQHLDSQEITQEDYDKAVLNTKRDYYKKIFDYYSKIVSDAIASLQQAEIQRIEDKYDVEIAAAEGNSEEVARLEKEKAQKKLEVEKQYADINFAVKASQIVADTSVAVMRTYAELGGGIKGIIAAAMVSATGVAQLAIAMSEWQKVKNMTLGGVSTSGSSSGARVASGREGGGFLDVIREQDGKRFDALYDPSARGFVDRPTVIVGEGPAGRSREWVASNAAVENPTVAPILRLIDDHQRAGDIATVDMNKIMRANLAGFAGGGSISSPLSTAPSAPSSPTTPGTPAIYGRLEKVMSGLESELSHLRTNGIYSSVTLSDFDRKQQLRDKARNIGKKNPKP